MNRLVRSLAHRDPPEKLNAYWTAVSGGYSDLLQLMTTAMLTPSPETFLPLSPQEDQPMGAFIERCAEEAEKLCLVGVAGATLDALRATETGRGYRRCYARFRSGRDSDTSEYGRMRPRVLLAVRGHDRVTTSQVITMIGQAPSRSIETTVGQILFDEDWLKSRPRINGQRQCVYDRTRPDKPLAEPVTDADLGAILDDV